MFIISAIADVANFIAVADADPTFSRTILIVASDIFPTIDNTTSEFIAADAKAIRVEIADTTDDITTSTTLWDSFIAIVATEASELIATAANEIFVPAATTLAVQSSVADAYAIFVPTTDRLDTISIGTNNGWILVPSVNVVDKISLMFAWA